MLCKNPYAPGNEAYGCGQCFPCRFNRRRLWTHRMMLESFKHTHSSFATLTYSPEHLPPGGTLRPKDAQDWLKRLRRRYETPIRYFLVGEYGDRTQRPHYHAALFGVGIHDQELVGETWSKGHVYLGDLTQDSAQYVAGYVTKKMTQPWDPRLNGRHPEFARMSLRPGIGATAVSDIVDILEGDFGPDLLSSGDVPQSLNHGRKSWPLGRYLRSKIRERYGFNEKGTPKEKLQEFFLEMRSLLQTAREAEKNPYLSLKEVLLKQNVQKIRNLEARSKIYNPRRDL